MLDALSGAGDVAEAVYQLDDAELPAVAAEVLALMQVCERTIVSIVREALDRGVVDASTAAGAAQWVARLSLGEDLCPASASSGLNIVPDAAPGSGGPDPSGAPDGRAVPGGLGESEADDAVDSESALDGRPGAAADVASRWVRVPGLDPAHARRIAVVAQAAREPRNAVMERAVRGGDVGLATARTALEEVDAVAAVLPDADRDEIFAWFLALPAGTGPRGVRELTRRLVAQYGPAEALDDQEERLQPYERLRWKELPNGLVELLAELTPGHAEQLKHAIHAMSAPRSDQCSGRPGEADAAATSTRADATTPPRDTRTPGKRRVDALLRLVQLGATAADHAGDIHTSGSARLVVTIGYDELIGRLAGAGLSEAGYTVDAATVRRLACDGDIIPMVLGSPSEPLDVGRRVRLVDKGLRRAVIHRDKHCTFPGCDRLPSWCDVHHVIPWQAGGPTCLKNSALLCERHHTIVHRDRLTATVTPTAVNWDLTPGRMARSIGDAIA